MNLLGRKKDNAQSPDAGVSEDTAGTGPQDPNRSTRTTTAPKGRPTPKRTTGRRGPVAPAPMTAAEARKRRKETRTKLTREERKADKVARRANMADRREKMMAGDDAYLLPRDKGPVRRFARDIVDSRRSALGLFMPAALGMIFVMLSVPQSATLQLAVSYGMLGLVVIMVLDGFLLGRKVNRLVDEKFPDNTESGWKLGFYAASRASQLRRMRAPRPQVERGHKVT